MVPSACKYPIYLLKNYITLVSKTDNKLNLHCSHGSVARKQIKTYEHLVAFFKFDSIKGKKHMVMRGRAILIQCFANKEFVWKV